MSLKKKWKKFKKKMCDMVVKPPEPDHEVEMMVRILKGRRNGSAVIPCTMYTLTHSIDLNPSLIKRSTGRKVKDYKVGEQISFNPKTHDVKLTDKEKKQGVQLEELEECSHCGQKVVIAEVAETRYRSCPSVSVRLSKPASETLHIPVKFGIIKKDVSSWKYQLAVGVGVMALAPFAVFGSGVLSGIPLFDNLLPTLLVTPIALFVGWAIFYSALKTGEWYRLVEQTLKPIKGAKK